MNHTSNYQLNQWEPTDQVLRADFNADNAKIDEALFRADRRGLQVIKEIVTTEDTNDLEVKFPTLDWTEWKALYVHIKPGFTTTRNVQFYPYSTISAGYLEPHGGQAILFPLGRTDMPMAGFFWGTEGSMFVIPSLYYPGFHHFYLRADDSTGKIGVGTKITLYGELI